MPRWPGDAPGGSGGAVQVDDDAAGAARAGRRSRRLRRRRTGGRRRGGRRAVRDASPAQTLVLVQKGRFTAPPKPETVEGKAVARYEGALRSARWPVRSNTSTAGCAG